MGRPVPIKIRREVEWRFERHCGFPGCKRPAMDLHHTKRFSIVKRHLADEIVPLCKIHHELAHVGAIENEELLVGEKNLEKKLCDEVCRLKLENKKDSAIERIDKIVQRKKWEWKN